MAGGEKGEDNNAVFPRYIHTLLWKGVIVYEQ